MGKKYGYIAGPLFNEAEINQRRLEGKKLRTSTNINWYNPIEAPINDKSQLPVASDVFWGDTKEVLRSHYIIADLTNNDVGVAYELGIAWTTNYIRKILRKNGFNKAVELLDKINVVDKDIIGVASDIRIKTAGKYNGINVPYGLNQYVIGGILDQGSIVSSFDEAIKKIKNI